MENPDRPSNPDQSNMPRAPWKTPLYWTVGGVTFGLALTIAILGGADRRWIPVLSTIAILFVLPEIVRNEGRRRLAAVITVLTCVFAVVQLQPTVQPPHLSQKKRALEISQDIRTFLEERKRTEPQMTAAFRMSPNGGEQFGHVYEGWLDETASQFRLRFDTPIGQVMEDMRALGIQTGGLEAPCRVMTGNIFGITMCADGIAHVADLLPD